MYAIKEMHHYLLWWSHAIKFFQVAPLKRAPRDNPQDKDLLKCTAAETFNALPIVALHSDVSAPRIPAVKSFRIRVL